MWLIYPQLSRNTTNKKFYSIHQDFRVLWFSRNEGTPHSLPITPARCLLKPVQSNKKLSETYCAAVGLKIRG